jgi:hypothetical protein
MRRLAPIALLWFAVAVPGLAQDVSVPREPLLRVEGAGTPVRLAALSVDVTPVGQVAQADLELEFFNPNDRPLEGNLEFPLAPGQQVVGFALDIGGVLRDAVPVEKARGREVFEEIERRRVDPGLLEATQGNFFRLRIFPLPAHGSRRVRISLAGPLANVDGAREWRLPLAFAQDVPGVALRVHGDRPAFAGLVGAPAFATRGEVHEAMLAPRHVAAPGGVALRWRARGDARAVVDAQAFGDATWFVADVPVAGTAKPRRLPRTLGLLWDASGSAAKRDAGLERAMLDAMFRAMGEGEVRLVVLRDVAEPVRTFRIAGGDWSALRAALDALPHDGATALGGWTPQADVDEYLLVSDGLANYGAAPFPSLGPKQRLFALNAAGSAADSARLRALARAHGGRAFDVATPADADRAVAAWRAEPPRLLAVDALGAQDVIAESPFVQDGRLRLAGRLVADDARLVLHVADGSATRRIEVSLRADEAAPGPLLARTWAGWRLAELDTDPERNRAQARVLGERFGLATRETSLIVLETVEDYARYEILPPPELRAAYDALRKAEADARTASTREHLEEVASEFAQRQAWWEKDFPLRVERPAKDDAGSNDNGPAGELAREAPRARRALAPAATAPEPEPASVPAPAPAVATMAPDEDSASLDTIVVTGTRISDGDVVFEEARSSAGEDERGGEGTARSIQLQPWEPDSPYARRLRDAAAADVYGLYLDERAEHAGSTAFYLDVADILLKKGQRALALRVLSNLAELQVENPDLLRVLAYRLLQAGAPELAIPVLERVRKLAEEEPQSWRDLGLAYAEAGRPQDAVDALYTVVSRPWADRFDGVAMIALAELNAIAARNPGKVDLASVDERLRRNLPVALRAVLTWDADNTDMDLWVTQPDGEKSYYGDKLTGAGGRYENDFTEGYGPEEYVIRRAADGKYRIEANYFGERASLLTGAVTVQVWMSTDFGTPKQKDERLIVRLQGAKDTVLVGEFEVK